MDLGLNINQKCFFFVVFKLFDKSENFQQPERKLCKFLNTFDMSSWMNNSLVFLWTFLNDECEIFLRGGKNETVTNLD